MKDKEFEEILKKIRFDRQMKKKRLYEQAKRQSKKEGRCGGEQGKTK